MFGSLLHHFTAHEGNFKTTLMLINTKKFDPLEGDKYNSNIAHQAAALWNRNNIKGHKKLLK